MISGCFLNQLHGRIRINTDDPEWERKTDGRHVLERMEKGTISLEKIVSGLFLAVLQHESYQFMIKYARQQQAIQAQQQQLTQTHTSEEVRDIAAERERRAREEEEKRKQKRKEEARRRRQAEAEAAIKSRKVREVSPLIQRILEDHWTEANGVDEGQRDIEALLGAKVPKRDRKDWGEIFH